VVAAAMPEGNGSCSWLIICRFMGMARNTPMAPVASVKDATTIHGWWRWFGSSSMSAPNAVAIVAPVE
jgi:hypothetical protein